MPSCLRYGDACHDFIALSSLVGSKGGGSRDGLLEGGTHLHHFINALVGINLLHCTQNDPVHDVAEAWYVDKIATTKLDCLLYVGTPVCGNYQWVNWRAEDTSLIGLILQLCVHFFTCITINVYN